MVAQKRRPTCNASACSATAADTTLHLATASWQTFLLKFNAIYTFILGPVMVPTHGEGEYQVSTAKSVMLTVQTPWTEFTISVQVLIGLRRLLSQWQCKLV